MVGIAKSQKEGPLDSDVITSLEPILLIRLLQYIAVQLPTLLIFCTHFLNLGSGFTLTPRHHICWQCVTALFKVISPL